MNEDTRTYGNATENAGGGGNGASTGENTDKQFSVCIGNYGFYNEGKLVDKWVDLPMFADELEEWLDKNGLRDKAHEEIYISDYDGAPFGGEECEKLWDINTSLEDLNILAHAMDAACPGELETIEEVMDALSQGPDTVLGLANWILHAEEFARGWYPFSQGMGSPEASLGATYLEAFHPFLFSQLEELDIEGCALTNYLDYEALGNDMRYGVMGYNEHGFVSDCFELPDENYPTLSPAPKTECACSA